MKLIIDILGWTGSGFIIIAYALTLLETKNYIGWGKYLNFTGGLFIALNCYYYDAIPPFVTNLLWSVIATVAILKTRKQKSKAISTNND